MPPVVLQKPAIAAFVLAGCVAALFTPHVRAFAHRRRLLDDPGESRKVHKRAIPRIGGIAIVAAFYAPILGLLLYEDGLGGVFYANFRCAGAFLAGGLAIAALGLYDDVFGASAREKLVVQLAVAVLLYWCGYRIESVALPWGTIQLGIGALPLTVLWVVGVMNALNLIDGLDGLAGGVALFAVGTNLVVACVRGEPVMIVCMAALAGALIGFLFYNFNPASIFMGDSGSLFLGYILATSSIHTHQKSSAVVSLLIPAVTLALPIADTLLAMGRRALAGRSMFSPDKEHIHHRLLHLGLSHRAVVLVLYVASAVLGTVALALTFASSEVVAVALAVLALAAFLALRRLGFFRHSRKELARLRRRNLELRASVNQISSQLQRATTVLDVLESAKSFGAAVSADVVRLQLEPTRVQVERNPTCSTIWQASSTQNGAHDDGHSSSVQVPLPDSFGMLDVQWLGARAHVDRDHELAAQAVSRGMAHALRRITRGAPVRLWHTLRRLVDPIPANGERVGGEVQR